ncbi:hypothetical protein VCRA2126O295_110068 [Vibrio crassostreae]|nr:hypothetical protein VCRA2120O252_20053 [Vibrio crassostreae]CAK2883372.1 hypothetical protein VCRA2118O238_20514 [Vibrio crassostreae]CAK3075660.1 hypothetical protein VCRA2123O280_110078 [Vibrio crassostreae]CAK3179006.1 hypothetical protein VCRA2126O295_110068 [Vibrio crassostreae]CAK3228643.1 hypothetical protein VCRA2125O290_10001 [Vibrio crassostreae]
MAYHPKRCARFGFPPGETGPSQNAHSVKMKRETKFNIWLGTQA